MANNNYVYFVSLISNVPYVLNEALLKVGKGNTVSVFFDLDGARVLDKRYLKRMKGTSPLDLSKLVHDAINAGINLYGCQMNVLIAEGLELIEGAELAGVVTFLEIAYQADAVLSY